MRIVRVVVVTSGLLVLGVGCGGSDGGDEGPDAVAGTGATSGGAGGTDAASGTGSAPPNAGNGGNGGADVAGSSGSAAAGGSGGSGGGTSGGAVDAGVDASAVLMAERCPGDPAMTPDGECVCDVPAGTPDGCTFMQCGLIVGCTKVFDCDEIWGPCSGSDVCENNMCVPCTRAGPDCTEDCPCENGEGDCTGNDHCKAGLDCVSAAGERFGLAADIGVCMVTDICLDYEHALFDCGEPESLCGSVCPPCDPGQPDCTGKSCGSDGCFGSCGERCQEGEAGCEGDVDCANGLVCGIDNGARYGFPATYDVCWDFDCERFDPSSIPCGEITSPCGLCP